MRTVSTLRGLASVLIILFVCAVALAQEQAKQPAVDEEKCGMAKDLLDPLIDKAELNRFNTLRVEIVGNTYTGGREFWKRMVPGMGEGDIFTRRALEECVRRVSKLKTIYPISMGNIEVHLIRDTKQINITFCVRQKPKK